MTLLILCSLDNLISQHLCSLKIEVDIVQASEGSTININIIRTEVPINVNQSIRHYSPEPNVFFSEPYLSISRVSKMAYLWRVVRALWGSESWTLKEANRSKLKRITNEHVRGMAADSSTIDDSLMETRRCRWLSKPSVV
jgi:hypothetical protein